MKGEGMVAKPVKFSERRREREPAEPESRHKTRTENCKQKRSHPQGRVHTMGSSQTRSGAKTPGAQATRGVGWEQH